MRSKKSLRFMRFSGLKGFTRSRRFKNASRLMSKPRARVIGLLVLSIAAAAMLIAARQPSQSAEVAAVEPQPEQVAAMQPAPRAAMQRGPTATVQPGVGATHASPPPTVQARARQTTAATAPVPSTSALPARTVAAAAPATRASAVKPVSPRAPAPSNEPVLSSEPVSSEAVVQESTAVTITGCLERDNQTFRLKDTSGADAPRSRSWTSGFLRRRAAAIELVDAHSVKLTDHVGERVAVTGMLQDREMQVRSLQRVAASCNEA